MDEIVRYCLFPSENKHIHFLVIQIELQKRLAAVQVSDSAFRLSKRNCSDLIQLLISSGRIEVQ